MRLVIASANAHKSAEMVEILSSELGAAVEIVPRPAGVADVEETGSTLYENARLKAEAIAAATGEASVADDTGLEVAALGGAPGVYSARYAGEHASYAENVEKLIAALDEVSDRQAMFRTVALAKLASGEEVAAEGVVSGRITTTPRGTNGFGYDPIFVPDEGDGRTFAEMDAAEKQDLSHRGRAFRALAEQLRPYCG